MSLTLIIDGNNTAMRAFHTPQGELRSKRGEPTGVIMGTLNSLKGYLANFTETTKMVVVWDFGKSKERMALYPDYKMNRPHNKPDRDEEEVLKFEEFKQQTNQLHEFLPSLGVQSLRVKGWEADDLIYATACLTPGQKIIVSSDKDMYQMISEDLSVYTPYKDKVINTFNFESEMKVSLKSYMGYRSLLGDNSDNITGVPGIGEVTAKKLMDTYGHIDEMFKDKENLMKSKRTKKIFEPQNLAIIGRNHKLMNLGYVKFDDIRDEILSMINATCKVDTKDIREFLIQKEFVSILANFTSFVSRFALLGEEQDSLF